VGSDEKRRGEVASLREKEEEEARALAEEIAGDGTRAGARREEETEKR